MAKTSKNNNLADQAFSDSEYARGAGRVDFRIFIPAIAIILAVTIPLCFDASLGQSMVNESRAFVTKYLGWVFMWVPILCLGLILWLSFSRHGKVHLGLPEEKPEFSYFAWVSMLFCCGVGSSIIVWGVCEPIYYLDNPPLGIAKRSLAAYEFAHALP